MFLSKAQTVSDSAAVYAATRGKSRTTRKARRFGAALAGHGGSARYNRAKSNAIVGAVAKVETEN
jgi:hypothetical protein